MLIGQTTDTFDWSKVEVANMSKWAEGKSGTNRVKLYVSNLDISIKGFDISTKRGVDTTGKLEYGVSTNGGIPASPTALITPREIYFDVNQFKGGVSTHRIRRELELCMVAPQPWEIRRRIIN